MTRALLFFVLIAMVSSCNHESKENRTKQKPNIILIYADDLGYGDLSSYGSEIPTPHIDKIGENGIRFTDFYVAAPGCTPSRYALMTGAYPQRSHHGLNHVIWAKHDAWLDTVETILPKYLKNAGYNTAAAGKWHLGEHPMDFGFDKFAGFSQGAADYYTHFCEFPFTGYKFDWLVGRKPKKEKGYSTDLITDYAIEFTREFMGQEKPFFLYVPYNAPHYGKSSKENANPENTINLIGNDPLKYDDVFASLQAPKEYIDRFEHINDIYRRYYAAMLSNMDDNVGRLYDYLEKNNLVDNTLIFFISDNGGYGTDDLMHNHGDNGTLRGRKGELYEGGIRVPAFVSWPARIKQGQEVDQPIINLDILPTIANIVGFEDNLVGKSIDGLDISEVLTEGREFDRDLFWQYDQSGAFGFRNGNWKMVNSELYNLKEDLSETNNLADSHPEKFEELNSAHKKVRTSLTKYH